MSRRQVRHARFDGERVRVARKEIGLSNEALARAIDVSLRTVQRWQDGENAPQGAQLLRLAKALGLQPEDLYVEDEPADEGEAA
jgi:DNA-binding transcriptional regulator YiaG